MPNYSGACGMSYCVLPVYFWPGSVCINTQAKQEEAGEWRGSGRGTEKKKATKPTGASFKNRKCE